MSNPEDASDALECDDYTIIGGGIVGLVLALALHETHRRASSNGETTTDQFVKIQVYDKIQELRPVGAGMGLYPNGNRVLRDLLPPGVFARIRAEGKPYHHRQWETHDGDQVIATALESVLCDGEDDLASLGICRWRLHDVLFDAVKEVNIPVHFSKVLTHVEERADGLIHAVFQDGTAALSKLLLGCDGNKSAVRRLMAPQSHLVYTGVTCLMGIATNAEDDPEEPSGITFPCSSTTKCHGVFFPTQSCEQCFQIHVPVPAEDADPTNWSVLSEALGPSECHSLAEKLKNDGWAERFVRPIEHAQQSVKVGFCTLEPPLTEWTFGLNRSIVLLGDAAHPPVPYTGQGAQIGLEDVGVLILLLNHHCLNSNGQLDTKYWSKAMEVYQSIRIPRSAEILKLSLDFGSMQQKRAESESYDRVKRQLMRRAVFFHETLPCLLPGATYDYKSEVERVLCEMTC